MKKLLLILLLVGVLVVSGCVSSQTTPNRDDALSDPLPREETHRCEESPNPDFCYSSLASQERDSSLCEEINDKISRDRCYLKLFVISGRDYSIIPSNHDIDCDQLPSSEKGGCYLIIAVVDKDVSLCHKIMDGDKDTIFGCYAKVATEKNDISVCEDFQDLESKDTCYGFVAGVDGYSNEDLVICRDKLQSQSFKDECYLLVAIGENNESVCDNIVDQSTLEMCKSRV